MYLFLSYIMDEETLNRLAAEALIEEAKIGAQRAAIMGPSGWLKPKQTINKRFLHSTLHNTIASNNHRQKKKGKLTDSNSLSKELSYRKCETTKSIYRKE